MDDDVRRVRDETDIVRLVTEHTQLKKQGVQWMGLCPFHGEKSPSFSVNAEKGVYYCFGCQAKGDAIDFVRETEGLDFAGSVEFLAGKVGLTLRYTDHNEGRSRNRRKEHAECIGRAVDFYHERLLEDPLARSARDYLRSRGYDGDVARRFRIGWAPDEWSELSRHLRMKDDEWVTTGLGGINKRGGQYDFFRARIVFPIFDAQGNAIGFGGRKLPDGEGPKYKNTSDAAEFYSKSEVLYGLHWAKSEAGRTDELVVCEGYTDVIGCHLAGIERAVATCGTVLTPQHARTMGRFASHIVLAFDADGAGQAAAERVYAWEEEFGLRFAVAALPAGADPGDLAENDPDGLRTVIEQARPFLEFRVDRELDRSDLDSAEGRALAVTAAMRLVVEHPDALVRDQYVMRIADRCMVSADEVRRRAETSTRDLAVRGRRVAVDGGGPTTPGHLTPEHQALRLLVHRPEEVTDHLASVLFVDPINQKSYEALRTTPDLHAAMEQAGGAASDLLARLAVDDASEDDPCGVVSRLLFLAAERAAVVLEAEARQAGDLATYQPSISFLRNWVMDLREAFTDFAKVDPLLRWLVNYSEGRVDV